MPLHVESTNKVPLWSFIVRDRYLPPTEASIKSMMLSLEKLGQIAPIVARKVASDKYQLVVGATRFAAARELGWTHIQASIVTADNELEYQLAEIDENWERRELSKEERAKMREDRAELQRKIMAAVEPAKGGRGKKGGIREAARQAGVSRTTAYRKKLVPHSDVGTSLESARPATRAPKKPEPTKTARAAAAAQTIDIGPPFPEPGPEDVGPEAERLRVQVEEQANEIQRVTTQNERLQAHIDAANESARDQYVDFVRQLSKQERIEEVRKLIGELDLFEHDMPDIPAFLLRKAAS